MNMDLRTCAVYVISIWSDLLQSNKLYQNKTEQAINERLSLAPLLFYAKNKHPVKPGAILLVDSAERRAAMK